MGAITVGNAIATLALTLPSIVIGTIVSQLTVDRAASIGYEVSLFSGTISPVRIPTSTLSIWHSIMLCQESWWSSGTSRFCIQRGNDGQGIEIRWRPYQDHLCGLHAGATTSFHLSRLGRHGRTSCRRHNASLWLNQLSRDAHPTPQPGWCSGRYRAKEIPP